MENNKNSKSSEVGAPSNGMRLENKIPLEGEQIKPFNRIKNYGKQQE